MGIASILEIFGFKPKVEYIQPVNDKLDKIKEDLYAVDVVADYCSNVIDALNNDDKSGAVNATFEFCKIDDDVKVLQEIQEKVRAGENLDAAVSAANSPAVIEEIVASTRKEISDHYNKIAQLVPDIRDFIKEVSDKISNIKNEAAGWSWIEKILTADALRNTLMQINQVQKSAGDALKKMETLPKSLEGIQA
jgi:prophage DNA circulation protein